MVRNNQEKPINTAEVLKAYPELTTRPTLVAELETNGPFRRDFMRTVNYILTISKIQNRWAGQYALQLYWIRGAKHLLSKWRPIFEGQNYVLTNEMIGVIRNFMTNARLRLGMTERFAGVPTRGKRAECFVRRVWKDDENG